ncbi:heterokaryon incompatibility protein-domain-containing protein [Podospora aff. communis PSN243]|uniref:Heterokaryon incompatibility protein-domain-containing protein n=1 Tax=Podospora aff. communis PSN243 TaxID=3040156 RepID=A0AAV9GR81_9PEZI|nr:heterokaryon incompatibility protein-domain-containing protein [Podospora aff. communis PSN243]
MRLINIDTMKMEEFFGSQIPNYFILSHTWGDQEISYQDYLWLENYDEEVAEGIIDELMPRQRQRVTQKASSLRARDGFEKVQRFAALVRDLLATGTAQQNLGTSHIWVDTCCINKESSAELSEAINSMYTWYKKSFRCIAYLSDVDAPNARDSEALPMDAQIEKMKMIKKIIEKSRWFTRGWTLQELIAPKYVSFYDRNWSAITHRYEAASTLSKITGIDFDIFTGDSLPEYATVAERMSWAAKRQTTRVEDQAYCLMGLFGVNMPLLYGEGEGAFQRLQLEIIKSIKDHSICLWGLNHSLTVDWRAGHNAMLGRDANAFSRCGKVEYLGSADATRLWGGLNYTPYSQTNVGMEMTLLLADVPFGTAGLLRTFAILPVLIGKFLACIPLSHPQRVSPRAYETRALLIRHRWDSAMLLCPAPAGNQEWLVDVYSKDVTVLSQPPAMPVLVTGPEFDDRFLLHVTMPKNVEYLEMWSCSLASNLVHGSPRTGYTMQFTGSCAFQRSSRNPIFLLFRRHEEGSSVTTDILVAVSLSVQPARVNWIRFGLWSEIQGLQEEASQHRPPSLTALFLLHPAAAEEAFWLNLSPRHRFFQLSTQVQHRIRHGRPIDGVVSAKDEEFQDQVFLSVDKELDPRHHHLDEYDTDWQDFLLNTDPYSGESSRPLSGQPPRPPRRHILNASPWHSESDD